MRIKYSNRRHIISLIESGKIPEENIVAALEVTRVSPDRADWRRIIDYLLLWMGSLSIAFALLFFIAYNWTDLGRFAKFAMVEISIVLAIAIYWKAGEQSIVARASLLVATILVGVLLALYGQTYQTGADPWQLFFSWALLILPWAFIGRFPALWIVWVALINISIVLYHQTFRFTFWNIYSHSTAVLWLVFGFNTFVFIAWNLLAEAWDWLAERWATRILAVASGLPITWLVMTGIVSYSSRPMPAVLVWALLLGAFYVVGRKLRPDLFILAGCCLSGIVVLVTFASKHLFTTLSAGKFFFLALLVIALGAGAATWLKRIHREWQS